MPSTHRIHLLLRLECRRIHDLRFYQVGTEEEAWFAITRGRLLVCATHDYARAAQHYAREQQIDPLFVGGPTHYIHDVRELNQSLATAGE